ncbi:hypothetical protein T265_09899 [Opisthorchis viverrini]|uniref:Reverse transcriptase domain-containing protein n=1 Tax=Opisthorchis viverrini TaxID=6198 RepID=A0A074Z449_OPIVI|nr:hypothetical protein T265_09899 [Opisthorchis viverrini]KER21866.1 hypothetical protein T265_09899 [Opisthorchis viverrini]
MRDSVNVAEIPPIIAQWIAQVRKPSHHGKVRGSNPTWASRLPLSVLGQPGSIPALVLPSGGMAARHRKGATAERFLSFSFYLLDTNYHRSFHPGRRCIECMLTLRQGLERCHSIKRSALVVFLDLKCAFDCRLSETLAVSGNQR